ncbi:hypothetical protein DXG03_000420 [Asterophora parasitica]|uniref:F-actin-capping protein subunit beta n=1 Tax=Asterophora parasitica TaxID=117018 RepID=A0A9P7GHY0_9AGAR|nr:hypothetical protein DXG03_000420 [Asterophora parasitica]
MLQIVTRRGSEAEEKKHDRNTTGSEGWKSEGEVSLSGSMTRQTEQDWPLQDSSSHITNTGKMIEEMEIKMRNLLQEVSLLLEKRSTASALAIVTTSSQRLYL